MSDPSVAGRMLLLIVCLVPSVCALLIIIGAIIYMCSTKKSSPPSSVSKQSPFHADKKDLKLTSTVVPNGSKSPVMNPKRAQSVEYTFFSESGEIEEIQFYNDDNGQYTDHEALDNTEEPDSYQVNQIERYGQETNSKFLKMELGESETRFIEDSDWVRPSEISGHVNKAFVPKEDVHGYVLTKGNAGLHHRDDLVEDEHGYVNTESQARTLVDDDYVKPDPPRNIESMIDDDYVKPDPPRGFRDDINDDYVQPDDDYVQPDPFHNDDGYVLPDRPSRPDSDISYDYPMLSKGVNLSGGDHSYVN